MYHWHRSRLLDELVTKVTTPMIFLAGTSGNEVQHGFGQADVNDVPFPYFHPRITQ
jgi:hypothetical protein